MIDETLLAILACPLCDDRPPLRLEGDRLICDACNHAFPIVDGIPHLLPENGVEVTSSNNPAGNSTE